MGVDSETELPDDIRLEAPTFGRESVNVNMSSINNIPLLPRNSLRAPPRATRIVGGNEAKEGEYEFFGAYRIAKSVWC